ncbi:MAG: hypothetical protein KDA42_14025 [Planctomycetales bacterium]|nr:hypothetical protein [Planctomycetales bacterium]
MNNGKTASTSGLFFGVKARLKRGALWFRSSMLEPATFGRRLAKCDPVLVFQMGKVASTSVYYAAKESYPGAVVHTHWLTADHADWQVRRLYREVYAARRPLRVITLTREPIGRNLSAFFQNYEELTGTARGEVEFSVAELTELFLEKYHHDFPLTWFEDNIERYFGVDVYAEPFPDRGYQQHERGNVRLLLLRSELDDRDKAQAVGEFLDLPQLAIRPRNVGERKGYGDEYGRFKNAVKLPPEYIERMCASRYFQHFYAAETIDSVRAKWLARLENVA